MLAREAVFITWLTNTEVITQPFVTIGAKDRRIDRSGIAAQKGQLFSYTHIPIQADDSC